MLRLTGLVTGILVMNAYRSRRKPACTIGYYVPCQTAIKLLRGSARTGCPFHLLGVLATTFVQVRSLVSYSSLIRWYITIYMFPLQVFIAGNKKSK